MLLLSCASVSSTTSKHAETREGLDVLTEASKSCQVSEA